MSASKSIAVVVTSTRTPRVGPNVAAFVQDKLHPESEKAGLSLKLVNVADFNLPVYNEAVIPAMVPAHASFSFEHSKAWSAEMSQHDGYVFVIPEYNYGISGATKNAIDYLYNELLGKPVLIVSYGINGGPYASENLKRSLEGMKMKVCATRPTLAFKNGNAGPDLYTAMSTGSLGSDSVASWEDEKLKDLLQGFLELKEGLGTPKN
jgi:NAD(P)H-dependent FMN reductase